MARISRNGQTRHPEYPRWRSMHQRCYYERNPSFKYYGARGIKVCQRWWSFENYLSDMGPAPEGRSLDRIDNDGDYSPDNCRWATLSEQSLNVRARVRKPRKPRAPRETSAERWARFKIKRREKIAALKAERDQRLVAKKNHGHGVDDWCGYEID